METVRFSGGDLHEDGALLGSVGTSSPRLGAAETCHAGITADWRVARR